MSKIALDLKKFKHIKSDKDHTVLQHEDGHVLRMSHKALSPEFQKQLSALCQDPKEMNGGGIVNKASEWFHEQKAKGTFGEGPQAAEKADRAKKGYTVSIPKDESAGPTMVREAEGGEVKRYAEGDEVSVNPTQVRTENPNFIPPQAKSQEAPTEVKVNPYAEMYNKIYSQQKVLNPGLPDSVVRQEAMNVAEIQQDKDHADARNLVEDQQAKHDLVIQENVRRQKLGLKPLPVPAQPNLAPPPSPSNVPMPEAVSKEAIKAEQAAEPKAPSLDLSNPEAVLTAGYQNKIAGINQAAKAQSDLGQAEATLLNKNLEAQNTAKKVYQDSFNELEQERQNHMQDIKDGYIDPNNYWKDHSKIMTGIGMILAGFNPTNSPNAAVNFLKFQMEQNLNAQRENLSAKQNLLNANLRQFGNMRDAMDMTRIMQNDIVINQLKSAAAQAQSPMAKAAALQAVGQLQTEMAPMFQQFALRKAMSELSATNSPGATEKLIGMMRALNPEMAKEYEERYIPGIGLAITSKDATDLKEMRAGVLDAKAGIGKLLAISNKPFKSLSLEDIAEADTLRQTLVGALRSPITGPGAMNEGERELLERIIANPTSIFSLDSVNKKRLETLANTLDSKFATAAQARGVSVSMPKEAPQIKTVNGVKYMRGPNGEALRVK